MIKRLTWLIKLKKSPAKTVVVLGMHRSGTSLVGNILADMGVDMGERMLGANTSNPFGHFEDMDFLTINDMILKDAGGAWDNPPSEFQIESLRKKYAGRVRRKIAENKKKQIWGWKDPRTTLTFSHFKPYLDREVYIWVRRDKQEVVESLLSRDARSGVRVNKDKESLYNLLVDEYDRRTEELLKHVDRPIMTIRYEDLILRPTKYARRLKALLGRSDYKVKSVRKIVKPKELLRGKQKQLASKD